MGMRDVSCPDCGLTITTDNPHREIAPEHYFSGACDIMKASNSGKAAESRQGQLQKFVPTSRPALGKKCTDCGAVGKGKKFDATHAGHSVDRVGVQQMYKNGRLSQEFQEDPKIHVSVKGKNK